MRAVQKRLSGLIGPEKSSEEEKDTDEEVENLELDQPEPESQVSEDVERPTGARVTSK